MAALAAVNQRYGVFYFFSSSCAACEVFSPIMKGVADRYGMTVMAVSVDGGPSAVFPRYLVDTGQFQAMGMGGDGLPAPLTPRGGQRGVPQDQGMLSVANAQAVEIPRPADWDARRRRDYAAGRHPLPQGDGPHWHPFHQSQSEVDRKFLQHVWRKSRNQLL